MSLRSLLPAFLALALTGCFRLTIESDSGGYRGSADDKVSVQRGAAGLVAAETSFTALTVRNTGAR